VALEPAFVQRITEERHCGWAAAAKNMTPRADTLRLLKSIILKRRKTEKHIFAA